jgi:hypothetical protein
LISNDSRVLFISGGYVDNHFAADPLRLYRFEANTAPDCEFTAPADGSEVFGEISISGTASDPDAEDIVKVELLTPAGVVNASSGSGFATWNVSLDVSGYEPGSLPLKARAVDERFKYGTWDELTLIVILPMVTPTPTDTPPATPTPATTPTPDHLTLNLQLPQTNFKPGDIFSLDAEVFNPSTPLDSIPTFVVLQVSSEYFFWPSWRQLRSDGSGYDYAFREYPTGLISHEIIPDFIWPEGVGTLYGLIFYAVLTSPDLSGILTDIDEIAWGFME